MIGFVRVGLPRNGGSRSGSGLQLRFRLSEAFATTWTGTVDGASGAGPVVEVCLDGQGVGSSDELGTRETDS